MWTSTVMWLGILTWWKKLEGVQQVSLKRQVKKDGKEEKLVVEFTHNNYAHLKTTS